MSIVITTPAGNIGHQVVRELLDAGGSVLDLLFTPKLITRTRSD